MGVLPAHIDHVLIQVPGNSRLVGILKCHNMTDPPGKQKLKYLGSGYLISDVPRVPVEPPPDGTEDIAGENVDMGIDYLGKTCGDRVAFTVINGRKIGSEHRSNMLNGNKAAWPALKWIRFPRWPGRWLIAAKAI